MLRRAGLARRRVAAPQLRARAHGSALLCARCRARARHIKVMRVCAGVVFTGAVENERREYCPKHAHTMYHEYRT
ncbi:hypothetical protein EMCLV011R [Equine molluscum contagiosum-like virus]|nr:hypothetical protein EMCLV011R [Equine molluscum contagiosum-like virus]